ncbi:MAG: hypothetical protein ABIM29_02610 [candidate division WOR-3 bacterium]
MILKILIFSLYWIQTNWEKGDGQFLWQDSLKYLKGYKIDVRAPEGKLKPGIGGFYKKIDLTNFGTGNIKTLNYIEEDSSIYICENFLNSGKVFRYNILNGNLGLFFEHPYNKIVNNINKNDTYYFIWGIDPWGRGAYYYRSINSSNWAYNYTDEFDITNFIFSFYSYRYYFSSYRYDRIYYGTDISNLSSYLNLPYGYNVWSYVFLTKNNTLLAFTINKYLHYALGENIVNFTIYADTLDGTVKKVCEDKDSIIYAISEGSSKLFRSFNGGIKFPDSLWIDFGYPLTDIHSGNSGTFLILDEKYILKSFRYGNKWDTIFIFPQNKKANSIVETNNYDVFISVRADSPFVYKNYWSDFSYLESSIFKALPESINGGIIWGRVFFTCSLTTSSFIKVKIRTDTLEDMSTATPWEECLPLNSGDLITNYPSCKNGHRYIQYRVEFYLNDTMGTRPSFDEIKIEYEIDTTGPYIISAKAKDGGVQQNGYENDDYIEIVFSEKIDTNLIITQENIDSLFILSGGHHFSPFDSIVWKGERETLLIFMGNPRPDIPFPGDTLRLSENVKDMWGNKGYGEVIIGGSYDDIYPPKVFAILSDGIYKGNGIDYDDTLYFKFSEKTNTPYLSAESLEIYFDLIGKSWQNQNVGINEIIWKNESTLCITFYGNGLPSFFPNDSVHIHTKIKDLNGNTCDTIVYLTGSYDLKSPFIYEAIFFDYPPYGISPNSPYDHFILKFDEKTNKIGIDSSNIDLILKLSNNHSWLSGNGRIKKVEWLMDSILYIHPSGTGGYPNVSEGDTIYPDSISIKDIFGNPSYIPQIIIRYVKVEEETGISYSLKIYGNNLILFIDKKREVEIKIFDVMGREVFHKKYFLLPGIYKFNLLKKFKSGVYFIEILVEKKQRFKILKFKDN